MPYKDRIYMIDSAGGRQMMSLVITTKEGGLFLIDGGFRVDRDNLLSHLKEISGSKVPHLDAVLFTHAHTDHMDAFISMMEEDNPPITFDKVIYNLPSIQFLEYDRDSDVKEFYKVLPKFIDKAIVAFGGDHYEIKGMKIDILYTTDCEIRENGTNNSSMVFTLTIDDKTILILGDAGVEAGEKIARMYGGSLKSDYCQMAHHGQAGVDKPFYELVKPDYCLWPTPLWLWDNDAGKGYNTHDFKTIIVRGWMDEISPNRIDYCIKDGDQIIDL